MKTFLLSLLTALSAGSVAAQSHHLTLRLEDGLPAGTATVPITLAVPVTGGKGGTGSALAPFSLYGPHSIGATGLRVAGDRITGTITGKSRTGTALPVWTLDATIKDGRVAGMATAPAVGRAPAVNTRVAGYVDAPASGAWIVECGMPWTDEGSHSKIGADNANYGVSIVVRLRFDGATGKVVHVGVADSPVRTVQAGRIEGPAEQFTATITCLAIDGQTPIQITLAGGRIGRGGIVKATIQSNAGRVKEWKGAATVWAWPAWDGVIGGPEQALAGWKHDAEPDPALVAAAVKEAATPIRAVEPGTGEVWQHHSLQRDTPRCTAPPTFDIRPLPAAAKYRLTVTRIVGKPLTLVDEEVTDPFAALAGAWEKRVLGKSRFEFHLAGKSVWAMDVWLRPPGNRTEACPTWLAPVLAAESYRVRVTRDKDAAVPVEFTVTKPWEPLTEVWPKLAPGSYRVSVQGAGGRAWSAPFVKVATFQGPYFSGPARPYREAALNLARWTADRPALGVLRGHGEHNPPGAGDNGGSQILFGAVASGLVRYRHAPTTAEREAGLQMAVETGDFLRAACRLRGGMPKVYKEGIANAHLYGVAFLDLHAATKDERWREAALMVARAFAESQLPNGTWAEGWKNADIPARMKPVVPEHQAILDADLIPGIHGPHLYEYDCAEVLWFLGRLRQELATDVARECEEKAYRWVMDHSVKEWFWRDQGHHSPCMVPPFRYKGRTASYFALYLLECAPKERCDVGLVADLLRFCETRHVDWTRGAEAGPVFPTLVSTNEREAGSVIWLGTRLALAWARLGQRTGNKLDIAKARALMDAVTHAQHPVTGNIGTDMQREIRFNRFAVNAGRCAWNLMQYANLLDAAHATKP
jgi:hypothetical protein